MRAPAQVPVTPDMGPALRHSAAIAATVVVNVGGAVQTRINGELGARLSDGITAALLSTLGGLLLLAVAVPASRAGRRALGLLRAALRSGRLRWWHCLGGAAGGMYVACQASTVDALGVALFTVAVVAGTSAGSLAADRYGLGPGGRLPVTAARAGAAVLTVIAVLAASADRPGDPTSWLLAAVPLAVGVVLAWQTAVNGRVSAATGSPFAATLVNFAAATATLTIATAVAVAVRGGPPGDFPTEPWLYSGGLIGITLIVVAAAVVRRIGILVFGLASVGGQLGGAIVVDLVAPAAGRPGAATWLGVALTLVAVAVATWSRRAPA